MRAKSITCILMNSRKNYHRLLLHTLPRKCFFQRTCIRYKKIDAKEICINKVVHLNKNPFSNLKFICLELIGTRETASGS